MKKLEEYKKGTLPVEEFEHLSEQLLRAKFNADREDRWEEMLKEQRGIDKDLPPPESPLKSRRIVMWVAAAAAAAILLLFATRSLLFNINAPSYEQLAENFLTEEFFENQSNLKGDEDAIQLNINAAFAYNNRDFPNAINYYETIIANGNAIDEDYLFLGLSHLYNKEYTAAIGSLRQVSALYPDTAYKQEQQWFLALAFLENGDLENGKTALLAIKENQWNYDKAQELLNALE